MINIVLYEPEIPQNTGNIMRTCVATNSVLHLIEPLGFTLDEKRIKRSGMDYIDDLKMYTYSNFDEFKEKNKGKYFFITRYGHNPPSTANYDINEDIYLIFGKESTGVPKELLKQYSNDLYRLPMVKEARSLNLSNCVAICTYEVLRQRNYEDLSKEEYIKGKDYITK